jgi:hypothetical protein
MTMPQSFIRAYGSYPAITIGDLEAISGSCKAALLDMIAGDSALTFNSATRAWLASHRLTRATGRGHRTLELTSRGRWWAQAVLAYEADRLMAAAAEREMEPA